jgi:hypothetical protein
MGMAEVRKGRGMPFLKRGMRVQFTHNGMFGRISSTHGQSLRITLDGCNYSSIFHPKWMMRYFDEDGGVIAEYAD